MLKSSQYVEIKCCLKLSLKVFVEVSSFSTVGRLFQKFLPLLLNFLEPHVILLISVTWMSFLFLVLYLCKSLRNMSSLFIDVEIFPG